MVSLVSHPRRRPLRSFPVAVVAVLALAGWALPSPAQAQVVLYLYESGSDVILTGGGTLDLSGSTGSTSVTTTSLLSPSTSTLLINPSGGNLTRYSYASFLSGAPTNFGSGTATTITSATGDFFGLQNQGVNHRIFVPVGYAGGVLSTTTTFTGQTLAGLGATNGVYTWSWGTGVAQSFTLNVGTAAAVPEASPFTLAAAGSVAGAGFLATRRLRARLTR